MSSQFDEGVECGFKAALKEIEPLLAECEDVAFMLKDIERARQLPAYGRVHQQYIAAGKSLERLVTMVRKLRP